MNLMSVIDCVMFVLSIYPILGAFYWITGAICYRFIYRHSVHHFKYIPPAEQPFVTIMVPAHNEEVMIEDTLLYLLNDIHYDHYEVLVIDDCSTDSTPNILSRLQKEYQQLRVIRIEDNRGKAHAFNIGLGFAKGQYILSNDADTVPEKNAIHKYMNYFLTRGGNNIGAVTANMDVQNRSKLLEKSQTVEFSSIVGVIKRGQMATVGGMYAYSGANTMYRRDSVYDVGLFRQDRATEDISICWDQQFHNWHAVFAPDIMFYMNVPSNLRQLYRQRSRWAKGGTEVWLTNFSRVIKHPIRHARRLILLADQTLAISWAFYYYLSKLVFLGGLIYTLITGMTDLTLHLALLASVYISCEMIAGFIQIVAALLIDAHGAKLRYIFFSPLYMLLFWRINALTIMTTFIPAIRTIKGRGLGTWRSPERSKLGS